jgi:hypothetical protein
MLAGMVNEFCSSGQLTSGNTDNVIAPLSEVSEVSDEEVQFPDKTIYISHRYLEWSGVSPPEWCASESDHSPTDSSR